MRVTRSGMSATMFEMLLAFMVASRRMVQREVNTFPGLLERRRERRQWRRPHLAILAGKRMAIDVEHHRHERVITGHADQIHDAALAETLERGRVSCVADCLVAVQL